MNERTRKIKEEVLGSKERWQKKTTKVELSLWDCANIYACLEITYNLLKDKDASDDVGELVEKFKKLKFDLKSQL